MVTYDLTSKPEAIDLSHHLSEVSRSRLTSPLKGLYKYFNRPGMVSLAGGLPSPDYFPFESISAQVLLKETFKPASTSSLGWLWSMLGSATPATSKIAIPKYASTPTDPLALQLSTALQYGVATGLPALAGFIQEFTARVFRPAYSNFETLVNAGSTDAWFKVVITLCNKGDGILCEEWTYPSALSTAWPWGVKPIALPMDGAGMTAEGMEQVLANWDPAQHEGMRRPRVLYTVPVCQNPTGATMTAERKKAIYEVAVKYDVIIVEDDPYYFLQAGEYEPLQARGAKKNGKSETDEEFLASLIPSYLRFDYQGRVIRIDTFSKTIAPGSRLGWTTAQPILIERLTRANESSTQSASGFAQVLVGKLLVEEWGFKGYLQWLKGLKAQYRVRRDVLVDSLLSQADAALDARTSTDADITNYSLVIPAPKRMRDEKGFLLEKESEIQEQTLLSFVAPQGGMFVWLRIHTSQHPAFPDKTGPELVMALWEDLAEANILVAPGTMFSGHTFGEDAPPPALGGPQPEETLIQVEGDGFLRISFSTAGEEEMKAAMHVVGHVVKKFWLKKL